MKAQKEYLVKLLVFDTEKGEKFGVNMSITGQNRRRERLEFHPILGFASRFFFWFDFREFADFFWLKGGNGGG